MFRIKGVALLVFFIAYPSLVFSKCKEYEFQKPIFCGKVKVLEKLKGDSCNFLIEMEEVKEIMVLKSRFPLTYEGIKKNLGVKYLSTFLGDACEKSRVGTTQFFVLRKECLDNESILSSLPFFIHRIFNFKYVKPEFEVSLSHSALRGPDKGVEVSCE